MRRRIEPNVRRSAAVVKGALLHATVEAPRSNPGRSIRAACVRGL